jgi:hypothetical protein
MQSQVEPRPPPPEFPVPGQHRISLAQEAKGWFAFFKTAR